MEECSYQQELKDFCFSWTWFPEAGAWRRWEKNRFSIIIIILISQFQAERFDLDVWDPQRKIQQASHLVQRIVSTTISFIVCIWQPQSDNCPIIPFFNQALCTLHEKALLVPQWPIDCCILQSGGAGCFDGRDVKKNITAWRPSKLLMTIFNLRKHNFVNLTWLTWHTRQYFSNLLGYFIYCLGRSP